jgi:hypothetical protein
VSAIKNLDPERNLKLKDIRYTSNIERSLAKEYSSSYGKAYRGMSIALAMACMICSAVLVDRSFNHLNERYNTYESPYNVNAFLATVDNVNPEMIERLGHVDGISRLVLYRDNTSLKFFESDNPDFLSEEKNRARARLEEDKKHSMFLLTCMALMMQRGIVTVTNMGLGPAAGRQKEATRFSCSTGLAKIRGDPTCGAFIFLLAGETINEIRLRRKADPEAGSVQPGGRGQTGRSAFRYRPHASEVHQPFHALKLL